MPGTPKGFSAPVFASSVLIRMCPTSVPLSCPGRGGWLANYPNVMWKKKKGTTLVWAFSPSFHSQAFLALQGAGGATCSQSLPGSQQMALPTRTQSLLSWPPPPAWCHPRVPSPPQNAAGPVRAETVSPSLQQAPRKDFGTEEHVKDSMY